MALTAYSNSKIAGETEWGITRYDYEPRSAVHVAPSTTATCRSPARNQEAPPAEYVSVLYRIENEHAFVTGKHKTRAVALKSGMRQFTGMQRNERSESFRIDFVCTVPLENGKPCGRKDYVNVSSWRNPSPTSGCRSCRKIQKRKANCTVPADIVKDRIRREQLRLMNNPIWAERAR